VIHHLLRVTLVALTLSAPLAFFGWRGRLDTDQRAVLASKGTTPDRAPPANRRTVDSLLASTAGRAPFRSTRRPAARAYDPESVAGLAEAATNPEPKPPLVLTGIILGPEAAAILEGVPGHEGSTVIRQGATEAGIQVRRIGPHAVVLVGLDTTWTLTVRNPWQ
jgi:hypothetical protein